MALHRELMALGSYTITSVAASSLAVLLRGVFSILTHSLPLPPAQGQNNSTYNASVRAQRLLLLESLLDVGIWTNGSLERCFPTPLLH